MARRYSSEYKRIQPYVIEDARSILAGAGAGSSSVSALVQHALDGAYHSGTLAQTQAPWAALKTLTLYAGAGLTGGGDLSADRTFAVGAGLGITVNADDIALTTPGTLAVGSANSASGSHTHAITSSSNPGAAAALLATTAAGLLTLQNGAFVQAAQSNATFASGFAGSGWRADYGVTTASRASIETDDLTVRGRMRVYELLIQQIRATNGSVFVSSASKVVTTSGVVNPLWTVNGVQLTFNGANATLTTTLYTIATSTSAEDSASKRTYHGFLAGDVIRAQQVEWDGASFGGIIQSDLEVTSVANLYTYGAAYVAGNVPAIGYDYVRLGNSTDSTRRGSVYLTSDDSAAPFIDIVDGVASHADWNSAGAIKVRVGKLTGISDSDFGGPLSGYGLYGNNVYLKGNIYATSGQFTGTVYATSGQFSGTVYAATGAIGGWGLGATSLIAGVGATTVGLDSGGTNPAFYAGSATPGSAPFRVTTAGVLTATGATVNGAITATSGSITGNFYTGTNNNRFSTDGIRLKMPATSSLNINTSEAAFRWFEDLDVSPGTTTDYVGMVGYRNTAGGNNVIDALTTAYVGDSHYATYSARVGLQAGNRDGSTYRSAYLLVIKDPGANTTGTIQCSATWTLIDGTLRLVGISPPTLTNAYQPHIYYNSSSGNFVIAYDHGGTLKYRYLSLTSTNATWTYQAGGSPP